MTKSTRTAFSALTNLDPLRSVQAEPGSRRPDPATASIETEIARILAMPRGETVDEEGVRPLPRPPLPRPTTAAPRRARPRYGALGLVTSAALAVVATVLWVSPSAGEPIGQASVAHVGVIHHDGAPGTTNMISSIR